MIILCDGCGKIFNDTESFICPHCGEMAVEGCSEYPNDPDLEEPIFDEHEALCEMFYGTDILLEQDFH